MGTQNFSAGRVSRSRCWPRPRGTGEGGGAGGLWWRQYNGEGWRLIVEIGAPGRKTGAGWCAERAIALSRSREDVGNSFIRVVSVRLRRRKMSASCASTGCTGTAAGGGAVGAARLATATAGVTAAAVIEAMDKGGNPLAWRRARRLDEEERRSPGGGNDSAARADRPAAECSCSGSRGFGEAGGSSPERGGRRSRAPAAVVGRWGTVDLAVGVVLDVEHDGRAIGGEELVEEKRSRLNSIG